MCLYHLNLFDSINPIIIICESRTTREVRITQKHELYRHDQIRERSRCGIKRKFEDITYMDGQLRYTS